VQLLAQGNYAWPLIEVPLRVNPLASGMASGLMRSGLQPVNAANGSGGR